MKNDYPNLSTVSAPDGQAVNSALHFLQSLPLSDLTEQNYGQSLKSVLEVITEFFSADNGYVLLKSDDHSDLALFAGTNTEVGSPSTLNNAITDRTIQTNHGILVKDATSDKDFSTDPNFQKLDIKSVICVPINGTDVPIGIIYIDSLRQRGWDEQDLELLCLVGRYTGLALQVMRLEQERAKSERLITAGQETLHISHSVKNILQLISGATEVIDFGLRTDQIHRVKRSWDVLKPNLERIKKFMLDMLDFSKERSLEPGPCEFNRVIQSAIESLKDQLRGKKTKLHIRIDPHIPTVELDSERIHELATNLILNAIDVVDENTGVVTVETKHLPQQSAVQLSVTDNGPGISKEAMEKIFLPFQSTKNKLGTGLGLAIAKRIADQHKSRIEVESEVGRGTTFSAILPAKIVQKDCCEV